MRNVSNNHSIVTILSYAGSRIIIPGDNESASWKELLEDAEFVKAIKGTDILLASHHSRESGYCKELFDHIKPSLVLISDGPETDTSVTSKYYPVTTQEGWSVYKRSSDDPPEKRWVLTTRNDKAIVVRFGINAAQKNYRKVTVA